MERKNSQPGRSTSTPKTSHKLFDSNIEFDDTSPIVASSRKLSFGRKGKSLIPIKMIPKSTLPKENNAGSTFGVRRKTDSDFKTAVKNGGEVSMSIKTMPLQGRGSISTKPTNMLNPRLKGISNDCKVRKTFPSRELVSKTTQSQTVQPVSRISYRAKPHDVLKAAPYNAKDEKEILQQFTHNKNKGKDIKNNKDSANELVIKHQVTKRTVYIRKVVKSSPSNSSKVITKTPPKVLNLSFDNCVNEVISKDSIVQQVKQSTTSNYTREKTVCDNKGSNTTFQTKPHIQCTNMLIPKDENPLRNTRSSMTNFGIMDDCQDSRKTIEKDEEKAADYKENIQNKKCILKRKTKSEYPTNRYREIKINHKLDNAMEDNDCTKLSSNCTKTNNSALITTKSASVTSFLQSPKKKDVENQAPSKKEIDQQISAIKDYNEFTNKNKSFVCDNDNFNTSEEKLTSKINIMKKDDDQKVQIVCDGSSTVTRKGRSRGSALKNKASEINVMKGTLYSNKVEKGNKISSVSNLRQKRKAKVVNSCVKSHTAISNEGSKIIEREQIEKFDLEKKSDDSEEYVFQEKKGVQTRSSSNTPKIDANETTIKASQKGKRGCNKENSCSKSRRSMNSLISSYEATIAYVASDAYFEQKSTPEVKKQLFNKTFALSETKKTNITLKNSKNCVEYKSIGDMPLIDDVGIRCGNSLKRKMSDLTRESDCRGSVQFHGPVPEKKHQLYDLEDCLGNKNSRVMKGGVQYHKMLCIPKQLMCGTVTLPYGGVISNVSSNVTYFVISGVARVQLGHLTKTFRCGDDNCCFFIPRSSDFSITNSENEDLRMYFTKFCDLKRYQE